MRRIFTAIVLLATGILVGVLGSGRVQTQEPARRYIKMPDLRANAPYSSAVLVGDTLYLSGRTGADRRTNEVPADLEQEARNILDGMKGILAEAGMTMDDLVYVQIFCPDVSLYDQFNEVYRTYFTGELPARAFLGSGPLLRGAHFEVQAIARKP